MAEQEAPLKSLHSFDPTYVAFMNRSNGNAEAWWLDFSGSPVSYGGIEPGRALEMNTYLTHPWIFRASDGAELLVNYSEVYFPAPAQYDDCGSPLFQPVHVTAPVRTLQECCARLIRKTVPKEDVYKLEIPEYLKQDIRKSPDLLRDVQVLAARRTKWSHGKQTAN